MGFNLLLPLGYFMAIFVQRNDQRLGPFTVAEVRSQLASGALSLNDHVWWTGEAGWIPLVGSPVLKPGFVDPGAPPEKKHEGLTGLSSFSIAAVVAGCLFPFSFFTSVPAIVFGHCALDEIKKNPGRTGRGMAVVGLVLGYGFTLVSLVFVGCYLYFHDQVEQVKVREEIVNSDRFVPPTPATTTAPAAAPAPPAQAPATPTTNNLDQPIAPATANPAH
jgi:hypothetical protein